MDELAVSFADSITEIGEDAWDALAGVENPFMRYAFLEALERTGCTTRATGWQPQHLVIKRVNPGLDETIALIPLYLKNNSWGEYVFDWSWANAYESHGLQYYPKFVTSAPFTPSAGKRLFIKDGEDATAIVQRARSAIEERADYLGVSGWHVLFPSPEQHELLNDCGLMARKACQFHWFNRGFKDFADFLATMSSRKRKNINKERRRVQEAGISFRRIEGKEISAELWQDFYAFYQSTYLIRGMQGYLSQDFFLALSEAMPEQLFLVCAEKDGKLIAAALFFKSSTTLYGRYWGAARDYQFLHFETCYYQGQEYAIEHGLKSFDSGAQGEHKIQRGFEPIITYSNHWIANSAFSDAIANFLDEEAEHIKHYRQQAESLLPFKKPDNTKD